MSRCAGKEIDKRDAMRLIAHGVPLSCVHSFVDQSPHNFVSHQFRCAVDVLTEVAQTELYARRVGGECLEGVAILQIVWYHITT